MYINIYKTMSKPMILNGVRFKTKGAAKEHVNDILERRKYAGVLTTSEEGLMLDLLRLHEWWPDCPAFQDAQHIVVKQSPSKAYCFYAVSRHHPPQLFSKNRCFARMSYRGEINRVCRDLTFITKRDFKDAATLPNGLIMCADSGLYMDQRDIDVDHDFNDARTTMFSTLVDEWADAHLPGVFTIAEDAHGRQSFQDPRLNSSWLVFHNTRVRLRCVMSSLNRVPSIR